VIDVNIKGVFHCIRHFVPAMVRRKKGVIVNFSSYWGRSTSSGGCPYCATKWGIEGLTAALAEELPAGMAAVPLKPRSDRHRHAAELLRGGRRIVPQGGAWAEAAVPYILSLGAKDNGQRGRSGSVTRPGCCSLAGAGYKSVCS